MMSAGEGGDKWAVINRREVINSTEGAADFLNYIQQAS